MRVLVLAAAVVLLHCAAAAAAAESPSAVVPVLFQTAAGAAARGGDECKAGHSCPIPGSVCCPGGEFCCRYGCDTSEEPVACLEHPLVRQKKLDAREKAVADKEEKVDAEADASTEKCNKDLKRARRAARRLRKRSRKCARRIRRFRRRSKRKDEADKKAAAKSRSTSASRTAGGKWKKGGRARSTKGGAAATGKRKRGGKRLDVAKLRMYPTDKLVRVIERMYKQRKWMKRRLRKAGVVRHYSSCKEVKEKRPGSKTGRYTLRLRKGHLVTAHCDMDVDGGGWTSLLNPVSFPSPVFPGLLFEPTTVSGSETCAGSDFVRPFGKFNAIYHYKCGNVVTRSHYRWQNVLNATDVMLRATLQGETERTMAVNGRYVGFSGLWQPKADSESKGSCAFYTGEGDWTQETGINRCAGTPVPLTVKPLVLREWLSSAQSLNLKMQSGRAALPTASYGTGWNIATLMVR